MNKRLLVNKLQGFSIVLITATALSCKTKTNNEGAIKAKSSVFDDTPALDDPLPKNYQEFAACEKQKFLWDNKIKPSTYKRDAPEGAEFKEGELPPAKPADKMVFFLNMIITMNTVSDELPEKRPKTIHRSGAVATVKFVAAPNSPFTGAFKGAECGLIRLSVATVAENVQVPGAAVKFFVDGKPGEPKASTNFVTLFSLDGQANNYNFFANEFSNVVAPPKGLLLKPLAFRFRGGAFFETAVYLKGVAGQNPDGTVLKESDIVTPFRVYFVPNKKFSFAETEHDFRVDLLNSVKSNETLYEVFAAIPEKQGDAAAEASWELINSPEHRKTAKTKIGEFITTSEFVASRWADEKLFFQHERFAGKPGRGGE